MALLAEEIVEEWLNRQGFFTIRGVKVGVHEIDILALKPRADGTHDCRQVEVQASINPIAYISKVPKRFQRERSIGPDNAKKRPPDELREGVQEYIAKKFDEPRKVALRKKLCDAQWSRELVVNAARHPGELDIFREMGITVHRLKDILNEMTAKKRMIGAASGTDLVELVLLGKTLEQDEKP